MFQDLPSESSLVYKLIIKLKPTLSLETPFNLKLRENDSDLQNVSMSYKTAVFSFPS